MNDVIKDNPHSPVSQIEGTLGGAGTKLLAACMIDNRTRGAASPGRARCRRDDGWHEQSRKETIRSNQGPHEDPTRRFGSPLARGATLAEAAAYLRVPEAEVVRMVGPRGLPGRLIGSDGDSPRPLSIVVADPARTIHQGVLARLDRRLEGRSRC